MFKMNPVSFSHQQITLFPVDVIHKALLSDWIWLDAISGLWTLHDKSEFDMSFIIGPGGLRIVLKYLEYTYHVLDHDLADGCNDTALLEVHQFYAAFPTVICNLLRRFHTTHAHEHHLWDPDGFHELGTLLIKYEK